MKLYLYSIFGYTSPFNGWYIIGVNFTSVMTRQCQPSDYTRWSPTDEVNLFVLWNHHYVTVSGEDLA